MKIKVIACLIAALSLVGCGPKELTPEQKQQVDNLKTELSQTESDITNAKSEDQQYASGLIKGLIKSKLEILETNKALLQQRINAIESGAKIDIAVSGLKPDADIAASVLKDIDTLKTEIDLAKNDASQYNGGLALAMKMAAISTQEQTLAMLQQRYLSAKYGLAEVKRSPQSIDASIDTKSETGKKTQSTGATLPPADGPFGLQVGLTKKNIEDMTGETLKPVEGSYELYMLNSVPKQNPDFESFGVVISPKVGLCQIRAIGKDINTDSHGISLKSKFEEISDRISSIYGNGKKTDLLLSGSIWKEPADWMMGLNKKERVLFMEWKGPGEAMKKNEIINIGLEARSSNSSKGYIFLQYAFSNNATCETEIEDEKKGSL